MFYNTFPVCQPVLSQNFPLKFVIFPMVWNWFRVNFTGQPCTGCGHRRRIGVKGVGGASAVSRACICCKTIRSIEREGPAGRIFAVVDRNHEACPKNRYQHRPSQPTFYIHLTFRLNTCPPSSNGLSDTRHLPYCIIPAARPQHPLWISITWLPLSKLAARS